MAAFAAAITGFALIGVVLHDAFEVMLLPRRVHRHMRLTQMYFSAAWTAWSWTGTRVLRAEGRESFLSAFGALSMIVLFAIWAAVLILGYGLVLWALGSDPSFGDQLYLSGATFFTLGYGDFVPKTWAARVLSVIESGTGLGFIAVVIGYLPVLYQLYSRREAHVMQLDGRAGSPPTAMTMLVRHAELDAVDQLDLLLREWEVWSSELLESHLSYPMLVYYRSQHDDQSWLSAIAAIIDTCALILVGVAPLPPLQARMTFTMARQVLVEMARSHRIEPAHFDGGDRLTPDAFTRMEAAFREAGLRWTDGGEVRETLAALRATYEPLLAGLANELLLPVGGWLPAEEATDRWHSGHRGLIASRLIEQLTERGPNAAAGQGERFAQRVRSRLTP